MDLRKLCRRNGLKIGHVAKEIGMTESGLRWHIAKGFSDAFKDKVLDALAVLARKFLSDIEKARR